MPLEDAHKRKIDYLRISVTDRCNLACAYCRPQNELVSLSHHDILTYEEILRLLSVAVPLGISRVRITGGEPLVRLGLCDFIAALKQNPLLEDVSLTTNGVLLEEMAEELLQAGKPRLNISLDSLQPDRFHKITGHDKWHSVWRGICKASDLGFFPVKINMVPVKGVNHDEVVEFARLTLERKLHVRFIEFMPIGNSVEWSHNACVPSEEIKTAIEREFGPLAPLNAGATSGPSHNYQIPGACGVIGFISPITKHFCDSCRRLRLTADGKIRPCLLSETEIDVKSPLRSGANNHELERLIRLALEIKPERHYAGSIVEMGTGCARRAMSRIGG